VRGFNDEEASTIEASAADDLLALQAPKRTFRFKLLD
jgi:hypothetical protein